MGRREVWVRASAFLIPWFSKILVGFFAQAPLREEFWKARDPVMAGQCRPGSVPSS